MKRKLEKEKSKNYTEKKSSDESKLSESDLESSLEDLQEYHKKKKEEDEEEISKFSKKNDGSKKKITTLSNKIEEKTLELKDVESIRLTRHMIEKMVSMILLKLIFCRYRSQILKKLLKDVLSELVFHLIKIKVIMQ